jgi:carbon-monoxide dehydrogenase large subunit
MKTNTLGHSVRRVEDERFLTGHGRFVDDFDVPGAAHGHVLRSPHAHAVIERIEPAAAQSAPGVLGVFTESDLAADGIGPLPCVAQIATVDPLIVPPRFALARGRVRHAGDPVAFVVAESREQARDAAERVAIDYRALDAVTEARVALMPGAPQIWDEAPGNLCFRFQRGDKSATGAAFAGAAHVVEITLVNNRVVPTPIEPRAAIGRYDADAGTRHLLLTGQGVHGIRNQLANAVFHLPEARIHLTAPDVGGGFGMKNFLYPEWVLVLWAARRLGRPVRWVAERGEEFVSAAQGRDNHTWARLALDSDGRFLALDVATIANLGAYLSSNGPGSSTNSPATAMGGVYAIPQVFMEVRGAFTNTVPIDAYRGAGKPEANYLIERLVDLAARRLAIAPASLRRRNLIGQFPYRSALGMTIDCGRFTANLDDAATLAAGFAERRAAAAEHGRCAASALAAFSKLRAAPRTRVRKSASTATARSRWCSAPSRTARATRPAIRRSPLRYLVCRSTVFAISRPTRGSCAKVRGMAVRARCILAAARSSRRPRRSSPRAGRSPPGCCRPTPPKSSFPRAISPSAGPSARST